MKKKKKLKRDAEHLYTLCPREINWLDESLALHLSARMTGDSVYPGKEGRI